MIGNVASAVRDGVPGSAPYRCGDCAKWHPCLACDAVGVCERDVIGLSMRLRNGCGADAAGIAEHAADAVWGENDSCPHFSQYEG